MSEGHCILRAMFSSRDEIGSQGLQPDPYPRLLAPWNWPWQIGALVVLLAVVEPHLIFWVLLIGVAVPWLCGLAVAAFMTPPRPLAETSVLAKRLFWCLKALWGAFMIGTTAVYGAMVAIDLSTHESFDDEYVSTARELVLLPVGLAAVSVWFCAMWVAVDFYRCKEQGRKDAVDRLLSFVGVVRSELLAPAPAFRAPFKAWVTDALMACTRPAAAALLAYIVVPIVLAAGVFVASGEWI